jgi:flavin-dependent dehydrogenase
LTSTVDVLIAGAGPAGAVAALCLARAGISTAIVERRAHPAQSFGECLAPSATPLLTRLGLMPDFLATEPLACHGNRSSWGGDGRLIEYDFICDRFGNGWHIDRIRFDSALCQAAVRAGATLLTGATIRDLRPAAGGWTATLDGTEGGPEIDAKLVFDCTGRTSSIARRLGVRRLHFDRLVAATAYLTLDSPLEDSTTLIEAVPDGWWYTAPIPGDRLAIAFMTDARLLMQAGANRSLYWHLLLEATAHTRLRVRECAFTADINPTVLAAGTSRLERVGGDGWLAVGDAAAAHDPLSSHGIGTAIAAAAQAASAAVAYLDGDRDALRAYCARVDDRFHHYLGEWRRYYAEVRRWPNAPFWSRRIPQMNIEASAATTG